MPYSRRPLWMIRAGLGAFENEELEQSAVVMDRDTPLLIVIGDIKRIRTGPGAALDGHMRESSKRQKRENT